MPSLPAVGLEHPLRVLGHMLFLSDLLAFDTMLQVEPPQARHGDSLVSKLAMKKFSSIFQCITCPLLQSLVTRQEVDMMFFKFGNLPGARCLSSRLHCISAYMLHSVVGHTQSLCDLEI